MSKCNLGILVTMLASALGTWWIVSRQRARAYAASNAFDRGTVIFDNTPRPSDTEAVI